jgi:hypothetical protein
VSANIINQDAQQDYPDLPDFLRVPLTQQQRAKIDAIMAAARAPEKTREDLRAKQRETKREKSRIRIERLLAKKSGAAARMPLSGKAALAAIRFARPGQSRRDRPTADKRRARR